jgi:pyruvate formate lyase activating enzyme
MTHALASSNLFAKQGVRVCWETNGMAHPKLLRKAVDYSFDTGGCIKFDLKAYDEEIHFALSGISNQRTLENFKDAAHRHAERPDNPLVLASTLLVPGYVDTKQVSKIASMIASINPDIPYALLCFAPSFYMSDLPCTSARHAEMARQAALDAGLTNVRIGNRHLLGLVTI